MNSPHDKDAMEVVFKPFLAALKNAFGNEPWPQIERYAKNAWLECRDEDCPAWDAIRDRVRAEWP